MNDTIEKHTFNKKKELVKKVKYENRRRWLRSDSGVMSVLNEKDSVCFIYKYEYY